jgi:hypothetical protein
MSEHLSIQGSAKPGEEGLCCFWCPNEISTLPLDTSDALKIVKNGLEMRKL